MHQKQKIKFPQNQSFNMTRFAPFLLFSWSFQFILDSYLFRKELKQKLCQKILFFRQKIANSTLLYNIFVASTGTNGAKSCCYMQYHSIHTHCECALYYCAKGANYCSLSDRNWRSSSVRMQQWYSQKTTTHTNQSV